MKIQYFSDLHLEFGLLTDLPVTDADVVIAAGDIDIGDAAIQWLKQFPQPIVYVCGNHEFYRQKIDSLRRRLKILTKGTNVYFLDIGNSVEIQDVTFVGGTLWTDFKFDGESNYFTAKRCAEMTMNDYQLIYKNEDRTLRPEDTIKYHEKTLKRIEAVCFVEDNVVVVTHHAPCGISICEDYRGSKLNPAYVSDLTSVIEKSDRRIKAWIHGHFHHTNDYEVYGCRILSNPRGYHGYEVNPDFDPYKTFVI